jgi:hypothetical protein
VRMSTWHVYLARERDGRESREPATPTGESAARRRPRARPESRDANGREPRRRRRARVSRDADGRGGPDGAARGGAVRGGA